MYIARGKITYITKLQRKHVDEMQLWGKHTDPLFQSYNFPTMNTVEKNYWYRSKKYAFNKRCYVVFNFKNQLVGYIALRNIKWLRRISELGIVFDPNHLSKGYGTDSLQSFLKYYFEEMKMNCLHLRVAEFNKRAQACYIKSGFHICRREFHEFEDQDLLNGNSSILKQYRDYFRIENGILKCKYMHMIITKEEYHQKL